MKALRMQRRTLTLIGLLLALRVLFVFVVVPFRRHEPAGKLASSGTTITFIRRPGVMAHQRSRGISSIVGRKPWRANRRGARSFRAAMDNTNYWADAGRRASSMIGSCSTPAGPRSDI